MTSKQIYRLHIEEYKDVKPYDDGECSTIVKASHYRDMEHDELYIDGEEWSATEYATEYASRFMD